MKIYTRTGDAGSTSLVDGTRLPKNSARIEAYGTVDELNSFIGAIIATLPTTTDPSLPATLTDIQNRLFDIGSYLATAEPNLANKLLPDLTLPIQQLEQQIDRIDPLLPRHNKFILPQGTPASCNANIARAIARRAERRILTLAQTPGANPSTQSSSVNAPGQTDSTPGHCGSANPSTINPTVLQYINRLSDYLFILSRYLNHLANFPETYWTPAKTR